MASRNAIGVVIALAIGLVLNNRYASVGLSFGALMSSFSDSDLPYRQRAEHLIAASASIALTMAVGTQLGAYGAASAIVVAIVGFIAALAVCLGNSAADIGLAAIVTITVFSTRSVPWADAWKLAIAALAGGIIQTIFSLVTMPLNPYAPQGRLLADYYRLLMTRVSDMRHPRQPTDQSRSGPMLPAAEALAALDDDFSPQGQRVRSLFTQGERIAIQLARLDDLIHILPTELLDTGRVLGNVAEKIISGLAAITDIVSGLSPRNEATPPPTGIFTFDHELINSDLLARGFSKEHIDELIECLDTIARQIWIVSDIATDVVTARRGTNWVSRPTVRYNRKFSESSRVIAANFNMQSPAFRHGLRMASGLVLAMLLTRWFSLINAYWIPMTVGLVLKPDFGSTISRGTLRMAGTLVGLILLTWVYAVAPQTFAAPLIIVGLLIFLLRYFGPMNYGLFSVFISGVIVILLAQSGQHITTLIDARAVCTLTGGAIAITAYCLWPTREEAQIGKHVEFLIRSHQQYLMSVIGRFDPSFAVSGQSIRTSRRMAQLARTSLEASIIRLNAQTTVEAELNHLLSGIMASSNRVFNASASMEAMSVSPSRQMFIEYCRPFFQSQGALFTVLADENQTPGPSDAHQLVKAFRSIKPPGDLLENPIRFEVVRLVNSTNTLAEQIIQWRSWITYQKGKPLDASVPGLPSNAAG